MSYIALYRKWRPLVFEDVVEQEHVVTTLKHCVTTGRIAHAYLFCGTRGTGKTSMAHILSRAINCLQPKNGDPCNTCEVCRGIMSGSLLDVVEIDAASNNSVDNIRELREEVVYAPSRAKYKVYIIDEVHMLSTGAFNALLKTLEEPPEYVVFILATTEPHKLPATILSRCQRFDFRRISQESIAARLDTIAESAGVKAEPEALRLIARLSEGAMRDAISLLDQCISSGRTVITHQEVISIVGIVNETAVSDTVEAIRQRDAGALIGLIEKLIMDGKDISKFLSDLILHYRNMLICKMPGDPAEVLDVQAEALDMLKRQCAYFEKEEIIRAVRQLSKLEPDLKWSTHPRVLLEVELIKLSEGISGQGADLEERLAALERRMDSGITVQQYDKTSHTGTPQVPAAAPAAHAPEKTKKAAAGTKTDKAQADGKPLTEWPKILNEIKSSGRMALYTYLLDASAFELDDKRIGLTFKENSGLCRMMVSKAENLELLEQAAAKVLGKETAVRCISEDELESGSPAAEGKVEDTAADKAKEIAAMFKVDLNVIDD